MIIFKVTWSEIIKVPHSLPHIRFYELFSDINLLQCLWKQKSAEKKNVVKEWDAATKSGIFHTRKKSVTKDNEMTTGLCKTHWPFDVILTVLRNICESREIRSKNLFRHIGYWTYKQTQIIIYLEVGSETKTKDTYLQQGQCLCHLSNAGLAPFFFYNYLLRYKLMLFRWIIHDINETI